jgi:hypothetical protein
MKVQGLGSIQFTSGEAAVVGPLRPQLGSNDEAEEIIGPPRPQTNEASSEEDDDIDDEEGEDVYRIPLNNEIRLKGHTKACHPCFLES